MHPARWAGTLAATLALLAGTSGCSSSDESPPGRREAPGGVPDSAAPAAVVRVVDGDTVTVRGQDDDGPLPNADEVRVRLLEIDSPEVDGPHERAECFGDEASAYLTELLPAGRTVWVERDRELRDQYDRYLLYLWVEADGGGRVLVNERMVATGHAHAVLYEPNDRYIDTMRGAEHLARTEQRGLWGSCSN